MNHIIKKYEVQHPLLKNYLKFFWELKIYNTGLDHRIIPQRNINLRFNLSETKQYSYINGIEHQLGDVHFSGLQDKFTNIRLKLKGDIHVLGVSFFPDGFYPFFNIPLCEFRNQLLGENELGSGFFTSISQKIKEKTTIAERLLTIEDELLKILLIKNKTPGNFRQIFHSLNACAGNYTVSEFCNMNNIGIRSLERMFNKYIGIPASTYCLINRFHHSINQLLRDDYEKLSDLAFDNGYFDQMHFIRDFKRFAGITPKDFKQQNQSILQIGKLS